MEIGLLILVAALVVYVAIGLINRKKCNFDRRDSLEILKRRLASGEITLEEYEKIKSVL